MRKIETYGYLKQGEILLTKRNEFNEAVKNNFKENERFRCTIGKIYRKRSNNQNAYYWGVVIESYLQGLEETQGYPLCFEFVDYRTGEIKRLPMSKKQQADFAHDTLKKLFNVDENDIKRGTSENSTTQMEEYLQNCREYIREWFNIIVELPNEQAKMKL